MKLEVTKVLKRRRGELLFSKNDMIRWARYITDCKHNENELKLIFTNWHEGPEFEKQFDWVD